MILKRLNTIPTFSAQMPKEELPAGHGFASRMDYILAVYTYNECAPAKQREFVDVFNFCPKLEAI